MDKQQPVDLDSFEGLRELADRETLRANRLHAELRQLRAENEEVIKIAAEALHLLFVHAASGSNILPRHSAMSNRLHEIEAGKSLAKHTGGA